MTDGGALAVFTDPGLVEENPSISFNFGKRVWGFIGAASLVVGLLAMAWTFTAAEQFVTSRTYIVTSGANTQDNITLVRSFQALLESNQFATELKGRSQLDLPVETIAGMISVENPAESAMLEVKVTYSDIRTADRVSQEVLPTIEDAFEAQQQNQPLEARIPGPIIQEIWTRPMREVVSIPPYMGFLGGAVLGFVVAFAVAAFRQYRAPVVSSARDVGDALDLPVLARLPVMGEGRGANPQDAVLGMLSAIERLGARGPIHRLVVVGPEPDLERSKLVLALGCAIARNFDQPVALIDGDLEHGMLTKLIGASDEPGLAECLTGELRVDQTLLRLENGHTPALLNGMVPPSGMIRVMPAGLNRGGSLLRMRSNLHQVLGALSGRYVVVVDGPQVPGAVPSTQLLSMADATIVVVTEGSTSLRDARFTGEALRSFTTNPVGAIVLKK